jgi:hypothetical protein
MEIKKLKNSYYKNIQELKG